jgi:3-hydroxyisobutyrate dehydrogenase-like beta-hydroxyacid dehydrogenase
MKLAFLGLGVMGYPMAGHLQAKGHSVTVYNRTTAKAEAWAKQHGGACQPTIAEAVAGADLVMMCVGNDHDLYTVGREAIAAMKSGTILVDHTTASADAARTLYAEAKARGIAFIDAPVSGGQMGAEKGQLTVMCGGDESEFAKAKPVMDCYAKATTLLGASGAGQLTKMVNQICIAGLVQALSEGLAFAEKAGLDGNVVLDVISKGAAQSWQMENRGRTMLKREFNFGFAVDWMRKDLGICLDEARRNGARLPLTAVIDQFYGDIQKAGGNRLDTSSLIKRLD